MKREKWINAAVAAILSFLAALGGLGCMATGLELEADIPLLVFGCAVMAVVFSACFQTRLALVPLCVAAVLIGYWWREDTLRLSMESVIYRVSDLYDRGYGWGILQWTERALLPSDVTPALLALAVPLVACVSVTVVKGFLQWLSALVALLPLGACMILRDTVPDNLWLGMLLFAVLLLFLTESVRTRDVRAANRLTGTLTLPLLLAVVMLFSFSPRDTYRGQEYAQNLEELVLRIFRQSELPDILQPPNMDLIAGDQEKIVWLGSVGSREEDGEAVMTVKAQESGTIYLRGCAYDIYDGVSWSSAPGWSSWNLYYTLTDSKVKSLEIQTDRAHSVLYFTYNPYEAPKKVIGGRMENDEKLRSYTVKYQEPVRYDESWDGHDEQIGGQMLKEYLELPEDTRIRAEKILRSRVGIPTETISAGQVWKNAMLITEWVRGRGSYDLNTPTMPEGEEDFALWFLEKSKTGYCVHYATAAVVLLRAAGIPAQYVTGYLVDARAGQTVTVTTDQAHAWVEVFINGVGWVVMEPTPGYESQGTTPGGSQGGTENPGQVIRPTEPSETEPAETEPTETEPTETEPLETGPSGTVDTTTTPDITDPGTTTAPAVTEPEATGTDPQITEPAPTEGEGAGVAVIGGRDGPGGVKTESRRLLWLLLLIPALAAAVTTAQWLLRILLRCQKMKQGDANRQALVRWQLVERRAKRLKQQPEESLYWLAQKARFSQHAITEQELAALDAGLAALEQKLRGRSFLQKLTDRLIFALY